MKPITHAQKELMLEYFELLEKELSRELAGKAAAGAVPIEALAARVHERVARVAERVPGAEPPSLQQVRKNLEAVLDPAFFGEAAGEADPLRALGVLRQQLRHHKVYTPPEWSPRNKKKGTRRAR
jgi:hypothetical protein